MTRFLDGPAAGVTLMLRRAPLFLRVVLGAGGEWDALDQLDDTPQPSETIAVYKLEGEPTWVHVHATKGRSGIYRGGRYRQMLEPPADAVLRDTEQWRAWTLLASAAAEARGA